MTLNTEYHCFMSFILSVANKPILSAFMLNVVMLNVVEPNWKVQFLNLFVNCSTSLYKINSTDFFGHCKNAKLCCHLSQQLSRLKQASQWGLPFFVMRHFFQWLALSVISLFLKKMLLLPAILKTSHSHLTIILSLICLITKTFRTLLIFSHSHKKTMLTSLNRIYYWWYFGCSLLITILN